jgi:hypothetical protein
MTPSDEDKPTVDLQETDAAIYAGLLNLRKWATEGDADAATMLADCALTCIEYLAALGQLPVDSPANVALTKAASISDSWPISFPAIEDQRKAKLESQVPVMLGIDQSYRTRKNVGTRTDRNFDIASRTGFAYGFYQDLEQSRRLTNTYETFMECHWGETLRQANRASAILSQKHLHLDQAAFGTGNTPEAISEFERLSRVTPRGLGACWDLVSELADFSATSLPYWINAAIRFAEFRCGKNWPTGEWPKKLKEDADARSSNQGVSLEYAYQETVGLWLTKGFNSLTISLKT